MTRRILIRADGGSQQGLGHIFRSLSLAQMLINEGRPLSGAETDSFFFTTCTLTEIHTLLINSGFQLRLIQEESQFLSEVAAGDTVVMDGYHFSIDLQQQIRTRGATLVCVDDLADRHQVADVVVNHAPGITPADYSCEPYTRLCLGMKFAILRPEFMHAARLQKLTPRKDILLAFGGADPENFIGKYLPALIHVFPEHTIHVITGAGYQHNEELSQQAEGRNVQIHHQLNAAELSALMQHTALAVLSASTMAMEAIACRCRILAGWFVENQHRLYDGLVQTGVVTPMGNFHDATPDAIVAQAQLLLQQGHADDLRLRQFQAIDGRSGMRIRQVIEAAQFLTMRPATGDDLLLYYEWANQPEVRAGSFYSEHITLDVHSEWFNKRLADTATHMHVFEWAGQPCGQVRIQEYPQETVIGISVDPTFTGRGLSTEMLIRACSHYFRHSTHTTITAYIKKENHPSIHAFLSASFTPAGESQVNQIPCLKYILKNDAFPPPSNL